MAVTTVPVALVKKAWAKDTWNVAMNNIFFGKFMGEGPNNIIQIKEELKKEKGDTITIGLLMKLKGAGVTGDNMLEGHEEEMVYRDFGVTIDQVRNAVRLSGRMEEQKTAMNMRKDAKSVLSTWLTEHIDAEFFKVLSASPTTDRVVYAGGKTSEATVTETDIFTTELIGKAKRIAMTDANAKIRPVSVKGKNYYVMIIDPWQARDLRKDEKWLRAQENAQLRGDDNPIFTGCLGVYEGVVMHENEQISRTLTGATAASGKAKLGHALFMGAQAGVMAVGTDTTWEEDDFDYHNQKGFAIGRIMGIKKTQFKLNGTALSDFGCINVITSSKDD